MMIYILDILAKLWFLTAYAGVFRGALIKVIDNAGGISEDIINRVFEPYFTTKHQFNGTGLGLYMAKELVEKHIKGIISVQNIELTENQKKYKGVCFTIEADFAVSL